MTNEEIYFIMDAVESTAYHFKEWMKDYTHDPKSNEYSYKENGVNKKANNDDWFMFLSQKKPCPSTKFTKNILQSEIIS